MELTPLTLSVSDRHLSRLQLNLPQQIRPPQKLLLQTMPRETGHLAEEEAAVADVVTNQTGEQPMAGNSAAS